MFLILQNKKLKVVLIVVVALVLAVGILFYLQNQGIVKIFPTAEDRRIKQILTIDESKFFPAQDLPEERFREEVERLKSLREKVLENPQDSQAWFNFGYSKGFLNDHEGAVLAWEEAFRIQPLNFLTALNLANSYQYFLKNFPKAETYYLKALDLKPDYTGAYQGLVDLYRFNLKSKQDQVEGVVLNGIANDPANEIAYYSLLVESFAELGDEAKAKEYFLKLRDLNKEAADSLLEYYPSLK